MTRRGTILAGLSVFLCQLFLSEYLAVGGVRPDFLLIFVIYLAVRHGSMTGAVTGFTIGLIEDIASAGSLFGLSPLTKSLTGFLIGRLHGKFPKMNPLLFHAVWGAVVLAHFFVWVYVRFQRVYESSQLEFWMTWFYTVLYTAVFIAIMQVMLPLSKIQPEK